MKKIIIIALLFCGFAATAQKTTPGNYTYVAQKYEWDDGIFKGLGLPAGSGPAAFRVGQVPRAGACYYDSVGVDSGFYMYSGLAWRKIDGGGTTPTLQQIFDTQVGGAVLTKSDTILLSGFNLTVKGSGTTQYDFQPEQFNLLVENAGSSTQISGAAAGGLDLITNFSGTNNGSHLNLTDGYSRLNAQNTIGPESNVFVYPDSIALEPFGGALKFRGLTSGAGTTTLRYDPATGSVNYADTSAGGSLDTSTVENIVFSNEKITRFSFKRYENGTRYNAWGSPVAHVVNGREVIDHFYTSGLNHEGKSDSRWLRVSASGDFIHDTLLFTDDSIGRRDHGVGITADGTILVFYVENKYDPATNTKLSSVGMGFYRSTDGFATWTDHPISMPTGTGTTYANYGNLTQHPVTGRLYHIAYNTSPLNRGLVEVSDDDGLTWALHGIIPSATQYSEGTSFFLGGTTNANATLGYIVRNDVGKLGYFGSTDGGVNWTFVEELAWTASASKAPHSIDKNDSTVLLTWTDRSANAPMIRTVELNKTSLALLTAGCTDAARGKDGVLYESVLTNRTNAVNSYGNFGYSAFVKLSNDFIYCFLYDMSPLQPTPYTAPSDTLQCDIIAVDYEGPVKFSGYWTAGQSFTNGVINPILMTKSNLDNNGILNVTDSLVTVPRSGYYDININLGFSSATPSKWIRVYEYDPNETYDPTAPTAATNAKNILLHTSPPTALYSNVSRKVFLQKGSKIRFTLAAVGAAMTMLFPSSPHAGIMYGITLTELKE